VADSPISFARGAPAPELIPADQLAECAYAVAQREGAKVFSYGSGGGYGPLREWVAERHGVAPGRVVLTVGGLQGFVFHAAEQLARQPGRVLVEAPTYDRPLKILAREGAEVVALEMDEEGLDPDALAAELRRRSDRPSFLYTIPTFQNPSGRSLSPERRTRLVELVREHGLAVLEDDPYGLVRFEGDAPASLLELEGGELVTYTSSFSKTVAPGVRTGYFVLPESDVAAFEERAVSTYISPPFLPQASRTWSTYAAS
jgi:2-aminoadipate transaminase